MQVATTISRHSIASSHDTLLRLGENHNLIVDKGTLVFSAALHGAKGRVTQIKWACIIKFDHNNG